MSDTANADLGDEVRSSYAVESKVIQNEATAIVAPMVVIKKRANRGNIRRRQISDGASDIAESKAANSDDGSDLEDNTNTLSAKAATDRMTISDIKLQQQMRQRKAGASVEILSKRSAVASEEEKQRQLTNSRRAAEEVSLETMMGTQFSSQIDYGLQSSMPHKQIMDQFIRDKLGMNSSGEPEKAKELTADDLLYEVPEHIKVLGDVKPPVANTKDSNTATAAEDETNGVQSAWSTGIAEVALPIEFKLRNIEATERAAKQRGGRGASENIAAQLLPPAAAKAVPKNVADTIINGKMPFARFFVPEQQPRRFNQEGEQSHGIDNSHNNNGSSSSNGGNGNYSRNSGGSQYGRSSSGGATSNSSGSSGDAGNARNPLKRSMQSSDDYFMERYKKRQQQFWK